MKNLLFAILFLGLYAQVYSQEISHEALVINGETYPLDTFKTEYAKNIEYEGYENALNNYINYILMLQKADSLKVDTTAYYKNLLASETTEIKRRYLDKLIKDDLDSLNLPNSEITLEKRVELINNKVVENSKDYLKMDSLALQQVLKVAGEDFLNQKDSLIFNGNQWIFKTPTGKFTQQDLTKQLNFARVQIKDKVKLSDLIRNSFYILRDRFVIKDFQDNFDYYYPNYTKEIETLKKSILINYILEKEVYQKFQADELKKELTKYLKKHQDKYTWPNRYEVELIRYFEPSIKSEIFKALKNNLSADEIKTKFNNVDGDVTVVVNKGKFPVGHEVFGENFKPSEKIQEGIFRNKPVYIRVLKYLPASPMTVDEADKILKEDFYNNLLNNFFRQLKNNAEIEKVANI